MVDWSVSSTIYELFDMSTNNDLLANVLTN